MDNQDKVIEASEAEKQKERTIAKEQSRVNAMTKKQYRQYKSQWRKSHQDKVGLLNLPVNKKVVLTIQDVAVDVKPGDELYPYLFYPNGKRKPYWMVKNSIKELEKKAAKEKVEKQLTAGLANE